MQKEIYNENYFGTLMCILVDESRRIMSTFNPTPELHKFQNDMCKAGSWIDSMPIGTIVETVPQSSVQKLQADALPEYRRLAANLIDQFINEFEAQGGRRTEITEKEADVLEITDKYMKVQVPGTQLFIELFRDNVNIPYTGRTAGLEFEWQPKN